MKLKFVIYLLLSIFLFKFSLAEVKFKPGEISYLEINYQNTVIAGENYTLSIKATDAFGNLSNNFGLASKIKINSNGLEIDKSEFLPTDIKNGEFKLTVKGKKVGNYYLTFYLDDKPLIIKILPLEALSSSLPFRVINNKAENVIIESKDTFLPGYSYTIKLSFYDKEGNPVIEKSHINQTFNISANGVSKTLSLNDFAGYTLAYDIIPYTTTDFDIIIQDNENKKILASKTVKPELQTIGKIDINYPTEIEAGKPFTVKLKALDTQGRLIKVYNKIGKDVKLKVNGTGKLIPDIIQKEAFADGYAEIQAIYTKSETVNIEPLILDVEKTVNQEIEKENQKKLKEEKIESKPVEKKEKKQTSLTLKFPLELGTLSNVDLISKKDNTYIYTARFSKRNLNYEIKQFEKEINVDKENIGSIKFSEDQKHNIKIEVSLKEGFKPSITLLTKNTIKLQVTEE